MNEFICTKCNITKKIKFQAKLRYGCWCKDCHNKANRESYAKRTKLQNKVSNAVRNYKVSKEEIESLLTKNKKCKICKIKFKDLSEQKIDHCHKSGKIRGILCNRCNTTLGQLEENEKLFLNCIAYLKENN